MNLGGGKLGFPPNRGTYELELRSQTRGTQNAYSRAPLVFRLHRLKPSFFREVWGTLIVSNVGETLIVSILVR